MQSDPTYLGSVQDVSGATVSVVLDEATSAGLIYVDGHPYRVGQVGSFVRVPLGFTDLVGVVTRAGAGAVPENLAEIEPFGRRWMTVELLGTSTSSGGFERGVAVLPTISDSVHLVTEADLAVVYGHAASPSHVAVGRVASAESIGAQLDVNALVSRHSAVVGSTGSGKSTTVTTLLERVTDPDRFQSARVLLFDVHGEYSQALRDRAVTISVAPRDDELSLHVPYWALSFDELIPLTFGVLPDDAARGAIRDEIVRLKRESVEAHPVPGISSHEITVDTPVPFSIHRLWFDLHRLLNATHTAPSTGQGHDTEAYELGDSGEPIELGDAQAVVPPRYLAATQASGAAKIYLSGSTLNIRRQVDGLASRLRDPRFEFLFKPGEWSVANDGETAADLDAFLGAWLGADEPITILDLSGVPASVLTELIGALTRVIYDALFWARYLSEGGRERPLLFVFEEAHAYLTSAIAPSASLAVQRVVKEGRKYGLGAMVVSQRPSEIESTILSQCGTIVALRLSNKNDRAQVVSAVSDNLAGLLAMLPILRTGEAIVVGEAVSLPVRALIDLPRTLPASTDPKIAGANLPGGWDRGREPTDFADVVERWRTSDPVSRRVLK